MKQYFKFPGWSLSFMALAISCSVTAQSGEGYYGPTTNTGQLSHGVGTGAQSFSVLTGGSFDAFTNGIGVDNFIGPNGLPGAQEIGGLVAPIFDTLKLNNGPLSAFNITNTAGVIVNGTVVYNNGITTSLRTSRIAGLAAATQFLGNAIYTPALTPAIGVDTRFTDGFVSKVNPTAFVYPVGNVTDFRPITATGTGTFATAWNNSNVASFYTGALPAGAMALSTNGFWEWSGTAAATVTVSIPSAAALGAASRLAVMGYNGTAWVNLGGVFTTNTENSTNTAPVSVPATIKALAIGQTGVQLNAKIFLQGDMPGSGTVMRTDLQNYFGPGIGLLPVLNPYLGVETYSKISSTTGTAGVVVDWIQVQVRLLSNNYATSVETKNLLLKADGSIVDTLGAAPTFNAQTGTVRLVIKHRTHMGIMSNNITSFGGIVNYDFTTALAQASNDGGDPAQMKLINGVWTMISGDINMDGSVDASDGAAFKVSFINSDFDVYVPFDINMDGSVDASDGAIFKSSFLGGYYSTLVNF